MAHLISLGKQVAWHAGVRIASSAFSFVLFAIIAKRLAEQQSHPVFFLMFSLGFGIATLKTMGHLAAKINGDERTSARLRSAHKGLRFVIALLPVAIPLIGLSVWAHTGSLLFTVVACIVIAASSVDADLLRSVTGRGPAFPMAFAVGSALASIGVAFHPNLSSRAVAYWLLAQWLPIAILNGVVMFNRVKHLASAKRVRDDVSPHRYRFSMGLLALFDGIVLNAPFVGFFVLTDQAAFSLSLAMRIFNASLLFQPLLLHWSNSSALKLVSSRFGCKPVTGFSVILSVSGLLAGCGFALLFFVITGRTADWSVLLPSVGLLFSYSVYASQMRLVAPSLSISQRVFALTAPLAVFALALLAIRGHILSSALLFAGLQATTLFAAAGMIIWFARYANPWRKKFIK